VLLSQLGSGTNTTAVGPSGSSSASNIPQLNGGGSAEGNRGDGSSSSDSGSSSTSTGFSQGGGTSQASTFRGVSQIVAIWSAVTGLVVGGMFMLL
jgi:hypothetical protein